MSTYNSELFNALCFVYLYYCVNKLISLYNSSKTSEHSNEQVCSLICVSNFPWSLSHQLSSIQVDRIGHKNVREAAPL